MTEITPDQALSRVARTQGGFFTHKQARAAGLGTHVIKSRIKQGLWRVVEQRVYAPSGISPTARNQTDAALLFVGGQVALSHLSSARMHRIDVRLRDDRVYVTVPLRRVVRPNLPWIVATRTTHYDDYVTEVDGRPCMTVPRTIVDLAQLLGEAQMLRVLHDVVQRKLATADQIRDTVRVLERRAGCGMLKRLLEEFEPAYESGLSSEAGTLLARAGLRFEPKAEVFDGDRLIGVLDFADRGRRLGIEIDGRAEHTSFTAIQRDKTRDRAFAARGWLILRFTTQDVRRRPRQLIRDVERAIAARDAIWTQAAPDGT